MKLIMISMDIWSMGVGNVTFCWIWIFWTSMDFDSRWLLVFGTGEGLLLGG